MDAGSPDTVLQRIGKTVHQHGSYLLSRDEIDLLCGDGADDSEQFICIRNIAFKFRWAFELDAHNSSIRFKQLPL
jgi:hypothetical protein